MKFPQNAIPSGLSMAPSRHCYIGLGKDTPVLSRHNNACDLLHSTKWRNAMSIHRTYWKFIFWLARR